MKELSTSLEDYLETIYNIIELGEKAHVSQIADIHGVSRPSVTQVIARLTEMGYVKHQPYRDVKLTRKGKKAAKRITRKHELFREFLTDILEIPEEIAEEEACKLEHAIGPVTTEKFAAFVEYLTVGCAKSNILSGFINKSTESQDGEFLE